MNSPLVVVVVLNYNGKRWIEPCLASLAGTVYDNYKVILVDNASADGSAEGAVNKFPEVDVIFVSDNLGFSAGNNVGINKALAEGAEYVVLLNPDTTVEPGWLQELILAGQETPGAGILGAVQLVYEGNEFNTWTMEALAAYLDELADPAHARRSISVDWVEGACFAVKRRVFEEVGLLDPLYTAFYEEIDFCRRAACLGYQTVVVPRSRIHHYRSGIWKSDAQLRRRRNYLCDRSQFIYHLTEPRYSLIHNFGWYLITLATKTKEVLRQREGARAWDLLKMQVDLLTNSTVILKNWRRNHSRYGNIG